MEHLIHEHALVIVDTEQELKEKFDFFLKLIGSERITKAPRSRSGAVIITDDFTVRFILKEQQGHTRGMKCQHLFNLTQDQEYHNFVAMTTIVRPFSY